MYGRRQECARLERELSVFEVDGKMKETVLRGKPQNNSLDVAQRKSASACELVTSLAIYRKRWRGPDLSATLEEACGEVNTLDSTHLVGLLLG